MPMFDPITPVRKGGKTYMPGTPVELDDKTGQELVALHAVAPIAKGEGGKAASEPAKPAAAPQRKLAQMNKTELLVIVAAEKVEVAADASNKDIVKAIEAKRAAPAVATDKPLTAMNRDELVATAKAEAVEHADDADDATIVAAIEAKRGPAA